MENINNNKESSENMLKTLLFIMIAISALLLFLPHNHIVSNESDRYAIVQLKDFSSEGKEKEGKIYLLDKSTGTTWTYHTAYNHLTPRWHRQTKD